MTVFEHSDVVEDVLCREKMFVILVELRDSAVLFLAVEFFKVEVGLFGLAEVHVEGLLELFELLGLEIFLEHGEISPFSEPFYDLVVLRGVGNILGVAFCVELIAISSSEGEKVSAPFGMKRLDFEIFTDLDGGIQQFAEFEHVLNFDVNFFFFWMKQKN